MDTCPSEVLDLILSRLKASNDRAASACVSRHFLASARRVGFGGSVREGRYGSFPGQVIGLAACPRGKTLLVVTRRRRDGYQHYKEGRVHVVDALTGMILRSLHASYWGSSIAYSPDGESFVAIDVENANIYSVATLEKRRGLDVPEEPRNGHAAYAVAWGARCLCVMFFCNGSPPPREWYEEGQPEEPLTLLWDPEQLDAPPRVHVTDRFAQSATCLVLTDSAALMVGKFDNRLFRVPFDGEPGEPLALPAFDQRPGVVAIVDTPHGVLLVTISGKAVCVEGDVCVQTLDIGVGVNACCYDGADTVFAATDAGVVRIHHAEGCWRVAGAVGDPCTSIALLRTTGSLVTAHVDWEDITVSRPTFPACMEFALAAKPGGPRPKFPRAELLACSSTHAFVAPECWGVERGLMCVDMRRYVSVYTSFLPGAAHAVFPTPNLAEALVVLVSNEAVSSNSEVEDNAHTHVALISPRRTPAELLKIPQRFEGAAEMWGGALYLSGRSGVAMIENVLASGPLAVKSLTRTSCVGVRIEPSLNAPAGRGRVIGPTLHGADVVVRDPAAADLTLSSELGGLHLGPGLG